MTLARRVGKGEYATPQTHEMPIVDKIRKELSLLFIYL